LTCIVNVPVVRVNGSIVSLKVALTLLLRATSVARSAGSVSVNMGEVVSGAALVRKVQT